MTVAINFWSSKTKLQCMDPALSCFRFYHGLVIFGAFLYVSAAKIIWIEENLGICLIKTYISRLHVSQKKLTYDLGFHKSYT